MKRITRFEDIDAWQKARDLVRDVYDLSSRGDFQKDFGLKEQARRAAVSIMSNIAEGFGRRSNKEFANFLNFSHGSAAELQSILYVALDQNYIQQKTFNSVYAQCAEVSKMVLSFAIYLRRSKKRTNESKMRTS